MAINGDNLRSSAEDHPASIDVRGLVNIPDASASHLLLVLVEDCEGAIPTVFANPKPGGASQFACVSGFQEIRLCPR